MAPMRVIAGSAKGRTITAPKASGIRPTPARVREAVFSMLGSEVAGSRVADLFCGSAAMGIEALSRGARSLVAVDSSRVATAAAQRNLDSCGLSASAHVVCANVLGFLRGRAGAGATASGPVGPEPQHGEDLFDLVFVDPPYDMEIAFLGRVCASLRGRLSGGAIVVLERRSPERGGPAGFSWPEGYESLGERRYGDTLVCMATLPGDAGSAADGKENG